VHDVAAAPVQKAAQVVKGAANVDVGQSPLQPPVFSLGGTGTFRLIPAFLPSGGRRKQKPRSW